MIITIRILELNKQYFYESGEAVTFLKVMEALGLTFYRPCGGKGTCGNCRIKVDGVEQLGCKTVLKKDCIIEVPVKLTGQISVPLDSFAVTDLDTVAVDIGTTTIGVSYGSLSCAVANSQGAYGADVVSRLQAAAEDGKAAETMMNMVRADITRAMEEIGAQAAHKIVVSANTTMGHLLMGYPTDGLGAYPFKPYSLNLESQVWGNRTLTLMPGISAYVGADIVSGAYVLNMVSDSDVKLLMDLGTNAELLLWNGERFFATSAAAGPALEGGNLSCGMASVKGAVSHLEFDNEGGLKLQVIGDEKPQGLCGSAVIDLVAELKDAGLLDEGGLFTDESYQEGKGFPVAEGVYFSQEDVQQVILAKSAIKSAVEVLCQEAGVELAEISKLYVAGGLGTSVKAKSAVKLGLIPSELEGVFQAVGNTSLKGAIKFSREKNTAVLEEIISKTTVTDLGNSDLFQKLFLENLTI